jgi:hypothetical protein
VELATAQPVATAHGRVAQAELLKKKIMICQRDFFFWNGQNTGVVKGAML